MQHKRGETALALWTELMAYSNNTSRYSFLGFVLVLNILCQLDRNMLASFAPLITDELSLTDTQFGLLTGLIFSFVYAVSGPLMGAAADQYSRVRIVSAGLFVWSLCTGLSGLARNFIQMAFARVFIGAGEATLIPSATSMLSDIFPPDRRATAIGVLFAGTPLGLGASCVVAGLLGPNLGWRAVFYLMGALGVVLAVVMLFIREPDRGAQEQAHEISEEQEAEETVGFSGTFSLVAQTLKGSPALVAVILGTVIMHMVMTSMMFSQLWLVRDRGYQWEEIVTIFGIISVVFGTLGALTGGSLSDWYAARFRGGHAQFIVVMMVLLIPLILGYRFAEPGSPLFFAGMAAAFFYFSAHQGPCFSILHALCPVAVRATMVGLTMFLINVLSFGGGSLACGMISDTLRARGVEDALTWTLLGFDLLSFSAVACYLYISISLRRSHRPA